MGLATYLILVGIYSSNLIGQDLKSLKRTMGKPMYLTDLVGGERGHTFRA